MDDEKCGIAQEMSQRAQNGEKGLMKRGPVLLFVTTKQNTPQPSFVFCGVCRPQ